MEILDIFFTSNEFDLSQYYDDTKLSLNEATFAVCSVQDIKLAFVYIIDKNEHMCYDYFK